MAFLKLASAVALFTFPFALADAGDPQNRIPFICWVVGVPHLFTILAPRTRTRVSVGIALGSSFVFFLGFTINACLSLIQLFPTHGSSFPWFGGMAAHAVMLLASILSVRRNDLKFRQLGGSIAVGLVGSTLSIFLIQPIARA